MRIAPGLSLDELPDGVRLHARDWPFAWWLGAPSLAAGIPLVVWSAATLHWVECSGGAVFSCFGALCGWLASSKGRTLEIRGTGEGVSVRGEEGAGASRRAVALEPSPVARLCVRAFPTPDGAPELADRGGDLVLVAAEREIQLARRVGPSWRRDLERTRTLVLARDPDLR